MSISGNPARVADEIVKRKLAEFSSMLDDSVSAAEKLVNSAYEAAEKKLRDSITSKAQELKELLRSAQASADLQVKLKEDEIKNNAINDVMDEVKRRLSSERGDWYNAYLRAALKELSAESKMYGKFKIMCSPKDLDLVKDLVKGLEGLEVSDDTLNIIGGIVAVSQDGSVRVDYTLDQLISENEALLRGIASRALFGGGQ